MKNGFWTNIILLAIMCGALYLLVANLGNQYLWQDEAETALVSKTILTEGLPRGYDGKNYFSQELGSDYGKNYIWRRLMWLPYYTLAGFYGVFGVSTIVSRLPFVLFGLASVVMIYIFARAFLKSQRTALFAALMLTVCVAFLLLARQCRYYSLAIFFSLLALYVYVLLLERKRYAGVFLFAASTLLFHSQHIYIGILFGAIFLHAIIFHRDRIKAVIAVMVAVLLVNGPWIIWLMGVDFTTAYGTNVMPIWLAITLMISDILHFVFPAWLGIVAGFILIVRKVKTGRWFEDKRVLIEKLSLPVFFVIFNMAMILIVSPFPFFRYLGPSIPLLIMVMAMIIDSAWRMHKLLAPSVIVLMLWTSQFRYYIYEITHDFDGPGEGICKYLNEYGSENDVVAITYGDLPLKFYTKMRIVGGLTGEDLEPAKNAKWVILRKYDNCDKDLAVKEYLMHNINFDNYRRIELNYPDTLNENREYQRQHYFATQKYEDRVVIYERIK